MPKLPPPTAEWRSLFDACLSGDDQRLHELLAAGADPNHPARSGTPRRPLHSVCEFCITSPKHAGYDRCVKLLLRAGADPSLRSKPTNMRPVELAAIAGMEKASAKLQPASLDIFAAAAVGDAVRVAAIVRRRPAAAQQADEAGCTALWYGAATRVSKDRWGTVGILLDAGADPNASGMGIPALHMALGHSGNIPVAEVLFSRGADLHANTSLLNSSRAFRFQYLQEGLDWCAAHDGTKRH